MPSFRVVCDWQDGDVSDSDEMRVTAKTAAGAASKARAAWLRRFPVRHPLCRLEKVWVLTKARAKQLA